MNYFEYFGKKIPLNPGEVYIESPVTPESYNKGKYEGYHLIVIADTDQIDRWGAESWACAMGGELPTWEEASLIGLSNGGLYPKDQGAYWTKQGEDGSNSFDYNNNRTALNDEKNLLGAMAVRRIPLGDKYEQPY